RRETMNVSAEVEPSSVVNYGGHDWQERQRADAESRSDSSHPPRSGNLHAISPWPKMTVPSNDAAGFARGASKPTKKDRQVPRAVLTSCQPRRVATRTACRCCRTRRPPRETSHQLMVATFTIHRPYLAVPD